MALSHETSLKWHFPLFPPLPPPHTHTPLFSFFFLGHHHSHLLSVVVLRQHKKGEKEREKTNSFKVELWSGEKACTALC